MLFLRKPRINGDSASVRVTQCVCVRVCECMHGSQYKAPPSTLVLRLTVLEGQRDMAGGSVVAGVLAGGARDGDVARVR